MEFFKKIFKEEDRIIGLCGLEKTERLDVFIPKTPKLRPVYTLKYEKNFLLL